MLALVLATTLSAFPATATHHGAQPTESVRLVPGSGHLITRDKGPDPSFWAARQLVSVPIGPVHSITRDKGPDPAFWGRNEAVPAAKTSGTFEKGYVPDL